MSLGRLPLDSGNRTLISESPRELKFRRVWPGLKLKPIENVRRGGGGGGEGSGDNEIINK